MFKRLARVFKSWIGFFISFAEDPEVMLQESIEEMRNTLPRLNQILVTTRATVIRLEQETGRARAQGEAARGLDPGGAQGGEPGGAEARRVRRAHPSAGAPGARRHPRAASWRRATPSRTPSSRSTTSRRKLKTEDRGGAQGDRTSRRRPRSCGAPPTPWPSSTPTAPRPRPTSTSRRSSSGSPSRRRRSRWRPAGSTSTASRWSGRRARSRRRASSRSSRSRWASRSRTRCARRRRSPTESTGQATPQQPRQAEQRRSVIERRGYGR